MWLDLGVRQTIMVDTIQNHSPWPKLAKSDIWKRPLPGTIVEKLRVRVLSRNLTIWYCHDTIDTYRDTWVAIRYVSRYLRYDTYRDTWVAMRYVSRYLRYGTYRDTWVAIRYVSRYLSCDTICIAILELRYVSRYLSCDTIRIAIRYVSRYLSCNTIYIAILELRYDMYRDPWVAIWYVSWYLWKFAKWTPCWYI